MAETPPTYMSSALKGKKYDRPLTKDEESSAKFTPFEITNSKQKVYMYERTHTPKGKVERLGLGRKRKTRRHRKTSKRKN